MIDVPRRAANTKAFLIPHDLILPKANYRDDTAKCITCVAAIGDIALCLILRQAVTADCKKPFGLNNWTY
jgi:hypothetical protein